MKLAAVALLMLLQPSVSEVCVKFVYNSTVSWTDGSCVDPVTEELSYVGTCPSGQTCASPTYAGFVCEPLAPSGELMFPGEYCNDEFHCINRDCWFGKCPELKLGDKCNVNYACGINLTCSPEGKCVELAAVNSPCLSFSDCVMNAGCAGANSSTTPPIPGVCTAFLSIESQHPAPDCYAMEGVSFNYYCISGYCYINSEGVGMCSDVLPSISTPPVLCTSSSDCWSMPDSATGKSIPGYCECSYNGNSYCGLFPGDPDYMAYTDFMIEFLSSEALQHCNLIRNLGGPFTYMESCSSLFSPPSDEMIVAYYRKQMYPQITNVDADVLQSLQTAYYNAEQGASWWSRLFS